MQEASCRCKHWDRVSEVFLGVQEVSYGAGGKQRAIGIWRCRRQAVSCDDPFLTVPGSIPGSCIPAFTGTRGIWEYSGPEPGFSEGGGLNKT